jgi:heme exporter protein CcmD
VSEFFAMSGYGHYVWPAFGIGFGIVVLIYVMARGSLAAA